MIAKAVKGKGFRGALEYALRQEKGCVLDSNMAGDNPRTLAREFGEIRALRPNVTKAVLHVSISVAPNERLTDEQWCEVAHKYLEGMGLKESQYIAVKHTDTEHPHIHIIANRVSVTGEIVSDSMDYKRQEIIMRQLEHEYGLSTVKNSKESERKAHSKGEIEHVLRTGEKSARMQLQGIVDSALKYAPNLSLFIQRLETDGVSVKLNQASTGRISGISFSLDGVAMKGSDLGKAYTWNSLQKRGLAYEQDGYSARHEFGRNPETGTAEAGFERSGNIGNATNPSPTNGHGEAEKHQRVNENFERLARAYQDIDFEHTGGRSRGRGVSR